VQLSSKTDEVTSEDTAKKYEAWGWKVVTIDGHDHEQIRKALRDANAETEKPTLIIGETIMGKGCVTANGDMYEGYTELHGKPIGDTGADYEKTMSNLGADINDPLAYLAENVENMIVSSADLSNSDKTDGFLKKTTVLKKGDFSGAFLQAGVAELTMATIANGIALHGGIIPVVATFFVFSDYMKPAIRLSCIQELPVKFVWTHDAFRVGEDGPTHQPIEQEAQIRLLEKLKNHSHEQSFVALRPADSQETNVAWKMAMENSKTPTGLILSRQGIQDIPSKTDRYEDALGAEKGGYLVQEVNDPDVVLIANGSEVATLVDATKLLEAKNGLKVNIASIPSEGIFRQQSKAYQEKVIPSNKPIFGLTAGLPVNLQGLAGPNGQVFGLEHFGYSAPAKVLDEKFGFTGEQVYQQVTTFLK